MIFLIIYSVVVTIILFSSVFFNIKFIKRESKLEDIIEEALSALDEKEASISDSLSKPLFFDNPEIRKTIEDIKGARMTIIQIANAIEYHIQYETEELDEEELKKYLKPINQEPFRFND